MSQANDIRKVLQGGGIQLTEDLTDDSIKCPKCGSPQITANEKGFSLKKAAAGGILLGPAGLLGGLSGSKKIMLNCLRCGHKWEPGK